MLPQLMSLESMVYAEPSL